jgi:hypothetical protein
VLGSPGFADRINGDLNQQNQVSLADLAILQSRLGQATVNGPSFGDLDRNGTVGRSDVAAFVRNFGRSTTAIAASPEPSAVIAGAVDRAVTLDSTRKLRASRQLSHAANDAAIASLAADTTSSRVSARLLATRSSASRG